MSEILVSRLKNYILTSVQQHIDASDANGEEAKILSRGIMAIAIASITGKKYSDIAKYIIDGPGDNGVDGIFLDESRNKLYLAQSKWSSSGTKTIDTGSVEKFIRGTKLLVSCNLSSFNQKTKRISATIEEWVNRDPEICLLFCHNSTNKISNECMLIVNEFLASNNTDQHELVSSEKFDLDDLLRAQRTIKSGSIKTTEVNILNWGKIEDPYFSIYGRVNCSDVANWYDTDRDAIFSENIRSVLFDSDINEQIQNSLLENPQQFWYKNNGITAIANRVKRKTVSLGDTGQSSIWEIDNLRIVNGAQTTGAIYNAYQRDKEIVGRGYVNVKIISLEFSPFDLGATITKATNTQNKVEPKDFLALEDLQQTIADLMAKQGIYYSYKRGDQAKSIHPRTIDVQDAAIAIALGGNDMSLVVSAKRNSGALLDKNALYDKIFKSDIEVGKIIKWHTTNKMVEEKLYILSKSEGTSNRSLSQLLLHGNRFISHLIIKDMESDTKDMDITQRLSEKCHNVWACIEENFDQIYLAVLFKNTEKCIALKNLVDAKEKNSVTEEYGVEVSKNQTTQLGLF